MSITIDLQPLTNSVSDSKLAALSAKNPDLRLETDAAGKLIIMPPTGSLTGEKNADLIYQVQAWNRRYKLGKVFDSSTGFKLSNGAVRSPDVSWIAIARWNSLSDKQKRGFAPIAPDFVIELTSPTDNLQEIRQKMNEYLDCEVRLGWLIDPDAKQVEIYRCGKEPEIISNPISLSGESVLPNLTVDVSEIF